jgi:hypothetical protein
MNAIYWVLALVIGLPGLLVLLSLLVPGHLQRAREVLIARPARSLLWGLVCVGVLAILLMGVAFLGEGSSGSTPVSVVVVTGDGAESVGQAAVQAGPAENPGPVVGTVLFLGLLALALLWGLLVVAGVVGERVWRQGTTRPDPKVPWLGALLLGAVLLGLLPLAWIVGWTLLILIIAAGLGAGITVLFSRPKPQEEPAAAVLE